MYHKVNYNFPDLDTIKIYYKDIDWLKNNHTYIHYFGLGFIQIKITPNYRIHIYTELLPPIIGDEEIHNHRYSFNSYILKGSFTQEIYELIEGDKFVLEEESCNEGDKSGFIKMCDFKLANISTYVAGSNYFLSHETFHKAISSEAITLLHRPEKVTKEKALVARPKDAPKICPFSKKIEEKELWDIVAKTL